MDEYKLTKTIKRKNCTVNIYRPILTEKERTKRERQVMDALSTIARHGEFDKHEQE